MQASLAPAWLGMPLSLPSRYQISSVRLFGEGALSAAFIPVFTEYLETKGKKDAWELVNVTGTLLFIILGSLVVLAEISFSVIPTVFSLNSKWELVLSLAFDNIPVRDVYMYGSICNGSIEFA